MKTVFLRVIETEDKAGHLLRLASNPTFGPPHRFEVLADAFRVIPRSPFSYWVSGQIRSLFQSAQPLESNGRTAKQGVATANDFRFVRAWWEPPPSNRSEDRRWFTFAKGGAYSPLYADQHLVLGYSRADQVGIMQVGRYGRGAAFYYRPGLTWPLRTNGLSIRVMPAGCIFGHKGPAVFVEQDDAPALLALAAVTNSHPFGLLVALQLARTELAQSYEVGLIQNTPVPDLTPSTTTTLANVARCVWSLKRTLDTRTETSHALVLPALLQVSGESLSQRGTAWADNVIAVERELAQIQAEIDDRCFDLYGISDDDRETMTRGFESTPDTALDDDENNAEDAVDLHPLAANLVSWAVGVALGRFDLRLATGQQSTPLEPEPFDPLPPCSPGMLTGEDGLPLDVAPEDYPVDFPLDGIHVDDPGHNRHLATPARRVFKEVFGEDEGTYWHEAAAILEPRSQSLRRWLASSFFEHHIKKYSKSRRKAPIYWQLATPGASYSVWLYCHRFTRDTLFKVHGEFVAPKVQHEERKLASLRLEAGPSPTASQRKEIAAQEDFVTELRAFQAEVARVAPMWNPDLNDGVIINFAPLWRLVPQHKPWQKECKSCWDKLVKGDYDWAHLAMHLWPERVVPRCRKDRSLAIAHGLEEDFWQEDDNGKWQPRQVSDDRIHQLVQERTFPAVKAALDDLLKAPTPTAGKKRRAPKRRTAQPRTTRPRNDPSGAPQGRRGRTTQPVDQGTLDAIREAVAASSDGASKSDVLDTAGLSDAQWSAAIKVLLAQGDVMKTGKARGTRYHLKGNHEA